MTQETWMAAFSFDGKPVKDIEMARHLAQETGSMSIVEAEDAENGIWNVTIDLRAEHHLKDAGFTSWANVREGNPTWSIEIDAGDVQNDEPMRFTKAIYAKNGNAAKLIDAMLEAADMAGILDWDPNWDKIKEEDK